MKAFPWRCMTRDMKWYDFYCIKMPAAHLGAIFASGKVCQRSHLLVQRSALTLQAARLCVPGCLPLTVCSAWWATVECGLSGDHAENDMLLPRIHSFHLHFNTHPLGLESPALEMITQTVLHRKLDVLVQGNLQQGLQAGAMSHEKASSRFSPKA